MIRGSALTRAVVLFLSSPWITGLALADDVAVEDIVVTAHRESPAEAAAPTAFVTTIDPDEHAQEVETVTDALAESVGVQVRRFGGLGAFSTVSIRGSSSNQVQVYFDGIPLSRARNEVVNLGDLPIDSLDRIDVYRGTVPVSFGVAGLGGIVNLVPKAIGEEPWTQASLSYGSFNTRKAVASRSQRIGKLGLLAHASYLGSEGDFTYFVDGDPPHDGSPHQKRKNNEFDAVSGLLKAEYEIDPRTRVDLTSEVFFKDQGLPGRDYPQLEHTSFSEVRSTTYARITRTNLVGDRVDANATVFGSFLNEKFDDPEREFGGSRSDRDDVTTQIGGNLGITWRAPLRNEVSWFGECSGEEFNGYDAARSAKNRSDPPQKRVRVALAVQDQLRLFDERIVVVPTGRYERVQDQGSTFDLTGRPTGVFGDGEDLWTPGIGAQASPWPWLQLRGNIGRLNRAPSFSERFGNRGSVQGNPNLKTEKGLMRDVGFRLRRPLESLPEMSLEYAYFNNDVDDLIVILGVPGPHPLRPINVDSARIRGHEVSFRIAPLEWLEFDANYTYQDAENRAEENTGKQLPLRPRDEAYARVQFRRDGRKIYYEFNFVGSNYTTPDNFQRSHVDSREIHTVGAQWQPLELLSLGFEARNLGNDRAEDVGNYPLPGRSFFGTITLTL